MKILNYMDAIYISEHIIYVTGGISKTLNEISDKAYIYNPVGVSC